MWNWLCMVHHTSSHVLIVLPIPKPGNRTWACWIMIWTLSLSLDCSFALANFFSAFDMFVCSFSAASSLSIASSTLTPASSSATDAANLAALSRACCAFSDTGMISPIRIPTTEMAMIRSNVVRTPKKIVAQRNQGYRMAYFPKLAFLSVTFFLKKNMVFGEMVVHV